MKRATIIICVFSALSLLLSCPQPALADGAGAFADGNSWKATPKTADGSPAESIPSETVMRMQNIAYLKGLYNALLSEEMISNTRSPLLKMLPPPNIEKVAGLLDNFYSEYSYTGIPVINALIIIKMQTNNEPPEKIKIAIDNAKQSNVNIDTNL